MFIKKLKLLEGFNQSEDYFSQDFNLITSNEKNAAGKSTYCRLLFYALGYPIPSTEGIKFEKLTTEIVVIELDKEFTIIRHKNKLQVTARGNDFANTYTLPQDHMAFISYILNVQNPLMAKNLLGLMYIDQEKGWTMLNRGKVIGNIRFSIDELIASLKDTGCDKLFIERAILEDTIDKYKSIITMNSIKEQYYTANSNIDALSLPDDLNRRIAALQILIQETHKEINEINLVIKKDNDFFAYIESMNLHVNINGQLYKISKENIENSCSIEFLIARKKILETKIYRYEREKMQILKDLGNIQQSVNLFNENQILSIEKKINFTLSSLNINIAEIEIVLNKAKNECESINKQIRENMRLKNEYIAQIYNLFIEYAKELGVEKSISQNIDYIFTSDIKCRTGANFQKLIIAYKIAALKVVESVIGTKLIFLIDSPKSKELDDNNTKQIMSFLKDKLNHNQVFVSSIFSSEKLFIPFDKIITLKNRAIEQR